MKWRFLIITYRNDKKKAIKNTILFRKEGAGYPGYRSVVYTPREEPSSPSEP